MEIDSRDDHLTENHALKTFEAICSIANASTPFNSHQVEQEMINIIVNRVSDCSICSQFVLQFSQHILARHSRTKQVASAFQTKTKATPNPEPNIIRLQLDSDTEMEELVQVPNPPHIRKLNILKPTTPDNIQKMDPTKIPQLIQSTTRKSTSTSTEIRKPGASGTRNPTPTGTKKTTTTGIRKCIPFETPKSSPNEIRKQISINNQKPPPEDKSDRFEIDEILLSDSEDNFEIKSAYPPAPAAKSLKNGNRKQKPANFQTFAAQLLQSFQENSSANEDDDENMEEDLNGNQDEMEINSKGSKNAPIKMEPVKKSRPGPASSKKWSISEEVPASPKNVQVKNSFACDKCMKTFTVRSHLQLHMKSHAKTQGQGNQIQERQTQEKQSEPRRMQVESRNSQSQKKHTQEKAGNKCPTCGETFSKRVNLLRHKSIRRH